MVMTRFRRLRWSIISFCLVLTVAMPISCAPRREVMDAHDANKAFEYLQDGKITKEEIRDRLGEPLSSYENGRIVIYLWFDEKSKDYEVYNIVLVFEKDNVLKRHSLVRVR